MMGVPAVYFFGTCEKDYEKVGGHSELGYSFLCMVRASTCWNYYANLDMVESCVGTSLSWIHAGNIVDQYRKLSDGTVSKDNTGHSGLTLKTAVKPPCVSGQEEHSVNQKNLMFTRMIVYPIFSCCFFMHFK